MSRNFGSGFDARQNMSPSSKVLGTPGLYTELTVALNAKSFKYSLQHK